ncbi:MAG: class I SAM-dependent methyltransferase, partial [Opitutaceae bacterium]
YLECARCGTLRIAAVPADLARFYPADYYSFAAPPPMRLRFRRIRRLFARWLISSPDPLAAAVAKCLSYRRFGFFNWCRLAGARPGWRILDIGCGSGGVLRRMKLFGFGPLTGIDPYAPSDVREPGLSLFRTDRPPEGERFDLVMMNHVLEHLPDPQAGLESARVCLVPGGRLLVRVPIAGSFAHRRFGADWYHLDAPRHLVVPSLAGMSRLAERAGLSPIYSGFDGEEPSFLMSESYRQGHASRVAPRPNRRTRVRYRRRAHRLNEVGDGDLGVFIFVAGGEFGGQAGSPNRSVQSDRFSGSPSPARVSQ